MYTSIRKGVSQDEEGSIVEGGCVLGRNKESGKRPSCDAMPQVKELKELDVAGSATAERGRYGSRKAPFFRPSFRICLFFVGVAWYPRKFDLDT
jgi:hypothetical protein